jgi:NAD(P)-dependent dehydrogenase (short-subunit alcohol dehydrogenase family)
MAGERNMPAVKSPQRTETADPKSQGPKPEFDQEKIPHPGSTHEMNPKPDHGEESYKGYGRLKDRSALVTGGDSGIGRAVAIAFAREGADVLLNYLSVEENEARETARLVEAAGRKAVLMPGDLSNESFCNELIDKGVSEFGKIDTIANVAGYQMTYENLDQISTDEFDHTFKTNVYALFWLTRRALQVMKTGGAIINTASIQSYDPNPSLAPYAATKSAIVSLTKSFAQLGSKQGVRVNAVAPGPVWTPLIPSTMPEEKVKQFGKSTVFERPAQPVEVSPLFVFLASNEARFVTGEIYGVTGGRSPY